MPHKISGLRWYIAGLLCFASALNYLDRQTLSVLAQTIQDDLHITTVGYSHITMAFLLGIEADVSAWQLVDFVLGWFHVDIVKDDQWNRFYNEDEDVQPAPQQRQERGPARAPVETSTKG